MREEWYSFKEGSWVNEINVRSFIKRNFTLYEGDESFLVGPTEATKKLSEKIAELNAKERSAGGVLDAEVKGEPGAMKMDPKIVKAACDKAHELNEEANLKMAEKKSEYDMYKQTYQSLKVKADSGVALTESEKSLYKNVVAYMEKTGTSIHKISEGTTDKVAETSGEIKGYQSGYDHVADTMAEIQGMTDYAASFDKTTKVMCYVEGGAQTLNAASSAYSAYQAAAFAASGTWAFGVTSWAWAFVVLGGVAAASSGTSAAEQFKWAGEVGNEVDAREATQDLNLGTTEMYEEELDGFNAALEGIEDLELEVPTDVEAHTAMGVQTTSQTNTSKSTQDNKKPIKEETV